MSISATELIRHMRPLGGRVVAREILDRVHSDKDEFELVCELERRPPVPVAAVRVEMRPCESTAFRGFDEELSRLKGISYGQALRRAHACRAGVPGLHVGADESGDPIYAQWLLSSDDRDALASHSRGPWRLLADNEAAVEFAYTFAAYRGRGVMAAGMGQLLDQAETSGKGRVFTYVRPDNIASLRGCAKIGFVPSGIAVTSYRGGRMRLERRTVTDAEHALWDAATAPRSS